MRYPINGKALPSCNLVGKLWERVVIAQLQNDLESGFTFSIAMQQSGTFGQVSAQGSSPSICGFKMEVLNVQVGTKLRLNPFGSR